MTDNIEPLMIEVRASTQGFAQDIAAMRGTIDSSLISSFDTAGNTLERGLTSAIRRGGLGFDDLKRVALSTIGEISAQAAHNLFSSLPGGGIGGLLGIGASAIGSLLGLPGRATGGNVSPGQGYIIGERGPEMFVPTSSGRIQNFEGANAPAASARNVSVSISVVSPVGSSAPQSLQRSTRQVASAVRRAITNA